jgi:predicted transcriptional regulator
MRQEILNFLKENELGATWNMRLAGIGESKELLKALKELEAEGEVRRHRFSTANNFVWELDV